MECSNCGRSVGGSWKGSRCPYCGAVLRWGGWSKRTWTVRRGKMATYYVWWGDTDNRGGRVELADALRELGYAPQLQTEPSDAARQFAADSVAITNLRAEVNKQREQLTEAHTYYSAELAKVAQRNDSLRTRLAAAHDERNAARAELARTQQMLAEAQASLEALKQDYDCLEDEYKATIAKRDELAARWDKAIADLDLMTDPKLHGVQYAEIRRWLNSPD